MSELKATHIIMVYNGEIYEDFETVPCKQLYYRKDEADKVIKEKDKQIEELKCQVNGFKNRSNLWHYNAVEEHKKLMQADKTIAEKDKELRHHKYKRCLAMAERCKDKIENVVQYNEHDDWLIINEYWERWRKRWLKIAEKFKEAK